MNYCKIYNLSFNISDNFVKHPKLETIVQIQITIYFIYMCVCVCRIRLLFIKNFRYNICIITWVRFYVIITILLYLRKSKVVWKVLFTWLWRKNWHLTFIYMLKSNKIVINKLSPANNLIPLTYYWSICISWKYFPRQNIYIWNFTNNQN